MTKENNKVKTIFYINQDDKNLIKLESEKLQIKSSQYIRIAVREKLGQPILNVKKIQDSQLKKYISLLLNTTNNLNQIARKLNSNVKFFLKDQKTLLDEIENINNHILEIKSKI